MTQTELLRELAVELLQRYVGNHRPTRPNGGPGTSDAAARVHVAATLGRGRWAR